jgi:hypothetical protein
MTSPSEDYRLIPLTQGQFAKVDAADYEWLSQWGWYAAWSEFTETFYALRKLNINGKRTSRSMHREVAGLAMGDKTLCDHRSGDTLDNRRSNLRYATNAQNCRNAKVRKDNSSGFKGVHVVGGRFVARIQVDGKRISLGMWDTAEEAYKNYCEAAAKFHGDFARTA